MENTDQLTERKARQPIGVFDSGVGGISVLRELINVMPNEDYIYLGDSKNAPMTVQQEKFRQLMARYEDQAQIYPLPCPGLMEFVEAGDLESGRLYDFLRELLAPYLTKQLDSVVLGCTHYPFARKMIQQIVGENVTIFDGGAGTAREMRRRLAAAGLLNPSETPGTVTFENSLATEEELELCQRLLHMDI